MLKNIFSSIYFKIFIGLLIGFVAFASFTLYHAPARMGKVINNVLARQTHLKGDITLEEVSADFLGNVHFKNLNWTHNGETVLAAPEGKAYINLWDLARLHVTGNSVKKLELYNPQLNIVFDHNLKVDLIVPHKKDSSEQTADQNPVSTNRNRDLPMTEGTQPPEPNRYISFADQLPNSTLILHNATLGAYYKNRHYLLEEVDAKLKIEKRTQLKVDIKANKFAGDIVGKKLTINGEVDLTKNKEYLKLKLGLYEVVPSSLGLGKVSNPLTITGDVKGAPTSFTIDGHISMPQLDIPKLTFTNVEGDYHYKNSLATFENVTGNVFGGSLVARGVYNFRRRSYNIHGHIENIDVVAATKRPELDTKANLNLHLLCNGNPHDIQASGDVVTGSLLVKGVRLKSLWGNYNYHDKILDFYEVFAASPMGRFEIETLQIANHKVEVGKVYSVGKHHRVRIK